jgi:hypothetical protein
VDQKNDESVVRESGESDTGGDLTAKSEHQEGEKLPVVHIKLDDDVLLR